MILLLLVLLVTLAALPVAGAVSTPAVMPSRARASKSVRPRDQIDGVAGIDLDASVFGAAGVIDRRLADAAELGVDLGRPANHSVSPWSMVMVAVRAAVPWILIWKLSPARKVVC